MVIGQSVPKIATWMKQRRKDDSLTAFLFLAPSLVGFIVFMVFPVVGGFILSFTDWDMLSAPRYAGLSNYKTLITDPLFFTSLKNTLVFSLIEIGGGIPISLGLALLVNSKRRGIEIFRTIFFIPVVVSSVAASLVWKWIFQPDYGVLNTLLKFLHLKPLLWLGDPSTALLSVAIVSIWMGMGYNMVLFLAGLKGIPAHLHEAAQIDGANAMQRFWHITLPLLTPTLFFVLVMGIINSFQVFGQVFVMTENAGPGNSTLVYVYYLWQNAFCWFKMGYASALAYVLFVIIFIVTLIQMKFLGQRVTYEVG